MANDSLEFVQRGKVSIVRRQYAEAVKICRLGLLAHPTLLEGRLVLGMALTALERWDEVLAEMRVALEIDQQSALAWLLKGEALVGKGDYQQAEASLKRAKELDPSNSKADQLIGEIQIARAAGFEGIPAEPTDTKVYPARAVGAPEEKYAEATPITDPGMASSDDIALEYDDEATEVDPDPSDQMRVLLAGAPVREQVPPRSSPSARRAASRAGGSPAPAAMPALDEDLDKEDSSTENFVPVRAGVETSYEGPADDDYAERARPRITPLIDESDPGTDTRTPLESPITRRPRPLKPAPSSSEPGSGDTEPSIELSARDLVNVDSAERFDLSDDEDEETAQRRRRQVDENAGTRPETPEPVRHRARPLRPFEPSTSPSPSPRPASQPSWNSPDAPTGAAQSPPDRRFSTPGVVRVPLSRTAPSMTQSGRWERVKHAIGADRLPRGWLPVIVASLIVVIAVGVVTGLLVREWRMRARVAKRHELARQKLGSGNYPGFQAAELLYRQILTERDDPPARALRARVLAQMAFEFGDSPEAAERAVSALGAGDSEDAQAAQVYVAMVRGELDRAQRLASALRKKYPDALAGYLVGRSELLLERPETAVDALRAAAEREPRDPLVLHALGLAEAAARRDDRALDAYRRALDANANHIATLIDRAVLQVRRGPPAERDLARVALEGVTSKLVGDASPGQLARAFLGLAELELSKGNLDAARRALDNAVAKRREGDAPLSEELAAAFARAFQLDAAEKEARRAMAGSARLAPRLVLAEVALRRGRPQQAAQVIEEAGASRPEALVIRALANLQLGKREAARLDCESALRVQPDLIAAKVALARVDVADGHPDRAQRELDRLERAVKLPEVAAALGQVYWAEKVLDRARYWLGEALKRDPLFVEARLDLARIYLEGAKLEEARFQLNQVLQLNPAYAPARRELAEIALAEGDAVAARDQFDALAEKDPDVPTLLGAARARMMLGDLPGAADRAERIHKMDPGPAAAEEADDVLARGLLREHRAGEAVALLGKALPSAGRGETAALLMEAYLDEEQLGEAARVQRTMPVKLRGSVDVLVARARLALEHAREVNGEALAQAALDRLRAPTAPRWLRAEALLWLGRSQWEQGIFRPAQRSLKQATDLDPQSARAFYYLALVDEDLQRLDDARASMEMAARVDAKFPDALYNLGRLRLAAREPTAKEAFAAYLEIAPKGAYADEARRALGEEPAPRPTNSPPRKRRRGR